MIALVNADTLQIPLPDGSVHMACCSPPYWGLRDYGLGDWQGGDPGCDHRSARIMGNANKGAVREVLDQNNERCLKCGATRSNPGIGLEPLHDCLGWTRGENCGECYVCHMRQVAAEVWRVLRDDGTWWVNLGDSYAGGNLSGKRSKASFVIDAPASWGKRNPANLGERLTSTVGNGLKPKDLAGMPWRVALALQADGWYLRSDIIWAKPNPMPESVTDRPTKAHEYVFLFSKRARYFYDADAVREKHSTNTHPYGKNGAFYAEPNRREYPEEVMASGFTSVYRNPAGRNRRTVWNIATQPYSGAHFATWPEALVEPMVKAGTSEKGCCPVCGSQWERVTEATFIPQQDIKDPAKLVRNGAAMDASSSWGGSQRGSCSTTTTGWRPTCTHDAEPIPCTVLDPFAGSGTTGVVARRLGRHFIGLDLSYNYLHDQARKRLGLDKLAALESGLGIVDEQDYSSLPLFEVMR